jgi:hypothetical protein
MSKCKVIKSKACEIGNHQFIVSNWQVNSTSQKANSWTCQKCLHTIDGKHEVDKMREQIHAEPIVEAAPDKSV